MTGSRRAAWWFAARGLASTARVRSSSAASDSFPEPAVSHGAPLILAYVLEHLTPQLALAASGEAPRAFPS